MFKRRVSASHLDALQPPVDFVLTVVFALAITALQLIRQLCGFAIEEFNVIVQSARPISVAPCL
jgi:hypothetical protein